jgi:hypothetical protein
VRRLSIALPQFVSDISKSMTESELHAAFFGGAVTIRVQVCPRPQPPAPDRILIRKHFRELSTTDLTKQAWTPRTSSPLGNKQKRKVPAPMTIARSPSHSKKTESRLRASKGSAQPGTSANDDR